MMKIKLIKVFKKNNYLPKTFYNKYINTNALTLIIKIIMTLKMQISLFSKCVHCRSTALFRYVSIFIVFPSQLELRRQHLNIVKD